MSEKYKAKDFYYNSKRSADQKARRGYPNANETKVFYSEKLDKWVCRFMIDLELALPKAHEFVRGNSVLCNRIIELDPVNVKPIYLGNDVMDLEITVNGLKKPIFMKNGEYIYKDPHVGLIILTAQGYKAKKNRGMLR